MLQEVKDAIFYGEWRSEDCIQKATTDEIY